MFPEAAMFPISTRDGLTSYRLHEQRAATMPGRVTERGFRPEVRVNGPLARRPKLHDNKEYPGARFCGHG